jgi:hypothetical protein
MELLDDDKGVVLDDNIRHDKEVKMKEEPQQAKSLIKMRKIMMKTMQTRLAWSSPGDWGENKLAQSGLKTTKYMLL